VSDRDDDGRRRPDGMEVRGGVMPRFLPGSGHDGPDRQPIDPGLGPIRRPHRDEGDDRFDRFDEADERLDAWAADEQGQADARRSRTALREEARARRREGRSQRAAGRGHGAGPDAGPGPGAPIDPGLTDSPRDPSTAGSDRPYGWPKKTYWRVAHARIDGHRQRVYVPVAPPLATQDRYRGPRIDRRRWLRILVSLGVVLVLVIGAVAYGRSWWHRQLDPPGAPGAAVTFVIPEGSGRNEIAQILHENGIITNEWAFRLYLDRKGIDDLQAGSYTMPARSSAWDIVDALRKPDAVATAPTVKLVIPEGLTLAQIADRVAQLPIAGISRDRFLDATRSGLVRSKFQPALIPSLEGLVFPATYDIPTDWNEERILERLVGEFDDRAEKVGLVPGQPVDGMDPYDIIKIASLIESEAKVEEDRPLISEVIHNRLDDGQRLQVDATVFYARTQAGLEATDRLTLTDLAMESPWNTYSIDGLPFTPISAPREASLDAALHPSTGTFHYYVLTSADGKHSFATTFEEFEELRQQAVRDGVIPG
jgi:UPF0755 protein